MKRSPSKCRLSLALVCLGLAIILSINLRGGDARASTGKIKGRIIDIDTKIPVEGVDVRISGMLKQAISDARGEFTITGLSPGRYILGCRRVGYETPPQNVVIVKSSRITPVLIELRVQAIAGKDIVVTASLFTEAETQSVSTVDVSAEEIRGAAGSINDIMRMATVLPSVATVRDESFNLMIVRGGNPIESGFILDNIEVPTISHFPVQGTSGGGVGLLNNDFIRRVIIHTGGFPAAFTDKLSSFTDIAYREGNRYEFEGRLDLNLTGISAAAEGPLVSDRGSWFFSARHSSLDILEDALQLRYAPTYNDFQGKVVYNLTETDRLSALAVVGRDNWSFTREDAEEAGGFLWLYGDFEFGEDIAGLNWLHLWPDHGHSQTSLAFTRLKFRMRVEKTREFDSLLSNNSTEREVTLRNINSIRLGSSGRLDFGFRAKHIFNVYDNVYYRDRNRWGDYTPRLDTDSRITGNEFGTFAELTWQPAEQLTITPGIRADYALLNENFNLSPRVGLSYRLSRRTTFNMSTGLYYQSVPRVLLAQNEAHRELDDPRAVHLVLGINQLLGRDAKLSVEVYTKEYRDMPLDPRQPSLFILDELMYRDPVFYSHELLRAEGRAFARGVELMIRKKYGGTLHGIISASYGRARYRDHTRIWRDRVVDPCFSFSAYASIHPVRNSEIGIRWVYADGVPDTPFDPTLSVRSGSGVFDLDRINSERLPSYHSMYLRLERQFHFASSNIIAYVSIWNVYNRRNTTGYYWSHKHNRSKALRSWGMVPLIGLKYEF